MAEQKKDLYDVLREVVDLIKPLQEDDRIRTIRWACEKLDIDAIDFKFSQGIQPKISQEAILSSQSQQNIQQMIPRDIKSFIGEKNPISDNHFAAAVAYYYQFEAIDKKEAISKDDLVEATRLVGRVRLKRPDQTLVNATNAGYLDNTSRGLYRLNSVGENLVAMVLPNADGTISAPKKRRKNANKIKKSKKGK